jgi:CBS domain-containing protein
LADQNESVQAAAERMHQHTVGALVVLDGNKRPIGIVTDRDLVNRVVASGKDPYTTTVGDVMTAWPTAVSEDAPIEYAVELMERGCCRRLPVIDHEGELVGFITLDDIVMLLAHEFATIGRLLERETPRAGAEVF